MVRRTAIANSPRVMSVSPTRAMISSGLAALVDCCAWSGFALSSAIPANNITHACRDSVRCSGNVFVRRRIIESKFQKKPGQGD
jgi:hypothetical protein